MFLPPAALRHGGDQPETIPQAIDATSAEDLA